MANFLRKMFLSEPKWKTLDIIENYQMLTHTYTKWTEPGNHHSMCRYNRAVREFTARRGNNLVVARHDYDEKKERPSSPQEIVQYPLTISVTVFNTKDDREVPVYCEVDGAFASRVYYKMKDIYEKQNGRIK
ncbi:MAG: hypothetical protein IKV93_03495 [Alphaproteobacteria bacterium]|nr:hypothetical protein [Alphaproteobacteria bacterium]